MWNNSVAAVSHEALVEERALHLDVPSFAFPRLADAEELLIVDHRAGHVLLPLNCRGDLLRFDVLVIPITATMFLAIPFEMPISFNVSTLLSWASLTA